MTEDQWSQIRHFKESEGWGDPSMMDFEFLYTLDQYRTFIGIGMRLTPSGGTVGVHEPLSLHYSGKAGDFIFKREGAKPSLFDLFLEATRFEFTEIGIYPYWESQGEKVGGIHFGKKTLAPGNRKRFWMGVVEAGKQIYVGLTLDNLRKHGVI